MATTPALLQEIADAEPGGAGAYDQDVEGFAHMLPPLSLE
jgi:hypothetical protein